MQVGLKSQFEIAKYIVHFKKLLALIPLKPYDRDLTLEASVFTSSENLL